MSLPPDLEDNLARALTDCEPRTDAEIIKVVEKVLNDMGLDHVHWEEIQEVKKDLVWVRDARTRCDGLKNKSLGIFATAIILAIVTVMGLGIKEWFEHG
jgi:hypothetical protein